MIEQYEVVRRGDVRRAKLYYLRKLTGKATKIKERRGADGELIVEPAYVPPVVSKKVAVPEVGEAVVVAAATVAATEVIAEEAVDAPAASTGEVIADAPAAE